MQKGSCGWRGVSTGTWPTPPSRTGTRKFPPGASGVLSGAVTHSWSERSSRSAGWGGVGERGGSPTTFPRCLRSPTAGGAGLLLCLRKTKSALCGGPEGRVAQPGPGARVWASFFSPRAGAQSAGWALGGCSCSRRQVPWSQPRPQGSRGMPGCGRVLPPTRGPARESSGTGTPGWLLFPREGWGCPPCSPLGSPPAFLLLSLLWAPPGGDTRACFGPQTLTPRLGVSLQSPCCCWGPAPEAGALSRGV